jgi:septal ring factor EnvC (AmiA/AmiB activator)
MHKVLITKQEHCLLGIKTPWKNDKDKQVTVNGMSHEVFSVTKKQLKELKRFSGRRKGVLVCRKQFPKGIRAFPPVNADPVPAVHLLGRKKELERDLQALQKLQQEEQQDLQSFNSFLKPGKKESWQQNLQQIKQRISELEREISSIEQYLNGRGGDDFTQRLRLAFNPGDGNRYGRRLF